MEANNETNIVEDKEIHPDVLYATMLAININLAATHIQEGKIDEQTSQALSSSMQLPNVIAIATSLLVCIRPLLLDGTIDFKDAVEKMYTEKEALHSQMDLLGTIDFIETALDIKNGKGKKIILDS